MPRTLIVTGYGYPQIDVFLYEQNDTNIIESVYYVGEPFIVFVRFFELADDILLEEHASLIGFVPEILAQLAIIGLDYLSIGGGYSTIWRIFLKGSLEVFAEFIADDISFEITEDVVIKTQNFSLALKGNVDVATAMNLKQDGKIWLWRVFFSVLSFDTRNVDVQFSNPERYYFGLLTFSNFGAYHQPFWLRTKERFDGIFQITPNATGKNSDDDVSFQNTLYPSDRATGFSYDLRKGVLVQAKVSAARVLNNVENWW